MTRLLLLFLLLGQAYGSLSPFVETKTDAALGSPNKTATPTISSMAKRARLTEGAPVLICGNDAKQYYVPDRVCERRCDANTAEYVCKEGAGCECAGGFFRCPLGSCVPYRECRRIMNNTIPEEPNCGPNEEFFTWERGSKASISQCEPMCSNPRDVTGCKTLTETPYNQYFEKCFCKVGYIRDDETMKCVQDCPKKKAIRVKRQPPRADTIDTKNTDCPYWSEKWAGGCERSCSNPKQLVCNAANNHNDCYCVYGLFRRSDGKCVAWDDCKKCNKSPMPCGENEVYMNATSKETNLPDGYCDDIIGGNYYPFRQYGAFGYPNYKWYRMVPHCICSKTVSTLDYVRLDDGTCGLQKENC